MINTKTFFIPLLLISNILFTHTIHAEESTSYNRLTFTVSAQREVENDIAIATLSASASGKDSAALSDKVNQAISWALKQSKQHQDIESRTLNYTSYPTYNDRHEITGWRVQQKMQLKSTNIKVLSQLLGQLQAQLQLDNMRYEVSPKVKRELEDQLTSEAIGIFKQRADQLKNDMEHDHWQLVKMNINAINRGGNPRPMAMEMRSARAAAPMATPQLQTGKQILRVDVMAEIELVQ